MKLASKLLITTLFGFGLTLPAQAATRPTYSYLELGYLDSVASDDTTANGGRFNFNVSLERWVFFTGEYNHADFDDNDLQARETSIGFGTHTQEREFQLFAAATYERSDLYGTASSDEGYASQLGVRWPVAMLEFGGDVKWYKFGRAGRLDRHRGTVQWRMSPTWAAVGTYQVTSAPGGSTRDWTVGFRAYFTTQYDLPPRRPAPETR